MNDEFFMRAALEEAQKALAAGEMPVGCAIVHNGKIIARAHNERETLKDPTAHAEILALRQAAQALGTWRLAGCTLYVTLEPCPMCAGAIVQSRISRVIFGAYDEKEGCTGSVYRLTEDPAFQTFCPADGGILQGECLQIIRQFFSLRRENQSSK